MKLYLASKVVYDIGKDQGGPDLTENSSACPLGKIHVSSRSWLLTYRVGHLADRDPRLHDPRIDIKRCNQDVLNNEIEKAGISVS